MNAERYQRGKEAARQEAIETQRYIGDSALSYGELAEIQNRLEAIGRRYGLLTEFRENGLL